MLAALTPAFIRSTQCHSSLTDIFTADLCPLPPHWLGSQWMSAQGELHHAKVPQLHSWRVGRWPVHKACWRHDMLDDIAS